MTAAQARSRLGVLLEERATARRSPLRTNSVYMDDLEAEIAVCRAAFVAAVVFARAIERGEQRGRLQG